MDDALVMAAVDLSGRGHLVFDAPMPASRIGEFDTELDEEFMRALAINGEFNLHVRGGGEGIPSTKGTLEG